MAETICSELVQPTFTEFNSFIKIIVLLTELARIVEKESFNKRELTRESLIEPDIEKANSESVHKELVLYRS